MFMPCLFCDGDASDPDHMDHCDGRSGHVEARHAAADAALPVLASGITPATYATSLAAAHSVDDSKDTQRARVLAVIVHAGQRGCTDDELQAALDLDGSSQRPRRWELWKQDRITIQRTATGAAVRRQTRTGRSAVVWIAVGGAA